MNRELILNDIRAINKLLIEICKEINNNAEYDIDLIENDITTFGSKYKEKMFEIVLNVKETMK